jgi:glutamate racemase
MIGIFDSGFGGLSILKAIQKELPQYRYIYLGDTHRSPYGNRSAKEILTFSKQAVDFLFNEGCELVIFACNTASAEALRTIQQSYLHTKHGKEKRLLGVIVPTAEHVAEKGGKKIGILATTGTVRSGTFPREIKKLLTDAKVFQSAAPLLVPLVEDGKHNSKEVFKLLEQYLKPLLAKDIDVLILGCTHYEHLEPAVRRITGKKVFVISQGTVVAKKFKDYLTRHPDIESKLSRRRGVKFYSTDKNGSFKRHSRLFFGRTISPQHAKLG